MIYKLKKLSEGFTLLYVEDNDGLREKALQLLRKIFSNVISATDGKEGYELFKEHLPQIVITDILMPKMDGLEMINLIKHIKPSTKFIITSAFDDKDYLFQAIEAGVFHYIKKPMKIDELVSTLTNCINTINREENSSLFDVYMQDMLNYQVDLISLMSDETPIFANQMFLDFFGVESVDEFCEKHPDFGSLLLEHKGFLYNNNDENIDWFETTSKEADKLFHIKIADKEGLNKHFILKMHPLPKKKNIYIMSLNDITDLNLLELFDSKTAKNDEKLRSNKTIINLMNVIKENGADIKVNNFYKGLRITNLGIISEINGEHITVKTKLIQLKSANYQKNMYITSEVFPHAIFCEKIEKVNFDEQTIVFTDMHFSESNPTQREPVRVFPEEEHTVSLFYEDRKYFGDVRIYDISVKAVKIELDALPAGLRLDSNVEINMVLERDKKPCIIHSNATVTRVNELHRTFHLVLKLDIDSTNQKDLIDYVAKRQMNLIREFKGLYYA